jgi:aminopeptidase N
MAQFNLIYFVKYTKYSPCFDEPSFKATYDITIEHPNNSIALSNWPQTVRAEI